MARLLWIVVAVSLTLGAASTAAASSVGGEASDEETSPILEQKRDAGAHAALASDHLIQPRIVEAEERGNQLGTTDRPTRLNMTWLATDDP